MLISAFKSLRVLNHTFFRSQWLLGALIIYCTDFALCQMKDIGPSMTWAKGFLSK